jgi:hypothetical protein
MTRWHLIQEVNKPDHGILATRIRGFDPISLCCGTENGRLFKFDSTLSNYQVVRIQGVFFPRHCDRTFAFRFLVAKFVLR